MRVYHIRPVKTRTANSLYLDRILNNTLNTPVEYTRMRTLSRLFTQKKRNLLFPQYLIQHADTTSKKYDPQDLIYKGCVKNDGILNLTL
jgi:hypothetical protein